MWHRHKVNKYSWKNGADGLTQCCHKLSIWKKCATCKAHETWTNVSLRYEFYEYCIRPTLKIFKKKYIKKHKSEFE